MSSKSKIETLITRYNLSPHPEGGYYKETYRSEAMVTSPISQEARSCLTQIYFLLTKGDVSRFHKVLHDEIWHYHEGDPLRLLDADKDGCHEIILGPETGDYHHVIKDGNYQAAESTGEYTLVGCTVAPGFDFADFSFLKDDLKDEEGLYTWLDDHKKFI